MADFQLLGAGDGGPVSRAAWKIREYSGIGLPADGAIDASVESVWMSKVEPQHFLELDLGGGSEFVRLSLSSGCRSRSGS